MTVNFDTRTSPTYGGKGLSSDVTIGEIEKKENYTVTEADINDVAKGKSDKVDSSTATIGMESPKKGTGKAQDAGTVSAQINWDDGNFIPSALLLALFEANKKMRAANLDARNTELNMQVTSLLGQVKDLKDAAAKNYSAAMLQGVMSIVSGTLSMATSAVGLTKAFGASKDLSKFKDNAEFQKEFKKASLDQSFDEQTRLDFKTQASVAKTDMNTLGQQLQQSANLSQAYSAAGSATSTALGATGSTIAAGQTKEASELEAEGKKKEAEATKIAAELQKTNEYAQNAKEQLKATLDLLQAIANAEKAVSDAVVKNMV